MKQLILGHYNWVFYVAQSILAAGIAGWIAALGRPDRAAGAWIASFCIVPLVLVMVSSIGASTFWWVPACLGTVALGTLCVWMSELDGHPWATVVFVGIGLPVAMTGIGVGGLVMSWDASRFMNGSNSLDVPLIFTALACLVGGTLWVLYGSIAMAAVRLTVLTVMRFRRPLDPS